jgi:hypothetical protein
MDSRSGLSVFHITPAELNVSKSCLLKVPSVICKVGTQACSGIYYHIDVTGDGSYNVDGTVWLAVE